MERDLADLIGKASMLDAAFAHKTKQGMEAQCEEIQAWLKQAERINGAALESLRGPALEHFKMALLLKRQDLIKRIQALEN